MKKESNCVRISESGTVCETIPDSNHPLNLYQRFNEWLFMSVAQIFKIATVRVAGFLLAKVNLIAWIVIKQRRKLGIICHLRKGARRLIV